MASSSSSPSSSNSPPIACFTSLSPKLCPSSCSPTTVLPPTLSPSPSPSLPLPPSTSEAEAGLPGPLRPSSMLSTACACSGVTETNCLSFGWVTREGQSLPPVGLSWTWEAGRVGLTDRLGLDWRERSAGVREDVCTGGKRYAQYGKRGMFWKEASTYRLRRHCIVGSN
ncbi:hypothetical protein CALVIDRAFT_388413 [Calocera viscosa TUFC12733]|uniref:Uncharacterized protein n=1 Tax=Calocera viscosa (strain TUFC12733) TaxID=1330018 RepID=A0A167GMD9_CALVF|nr:hypothetical protein CALVIDRAFT_388413 [Calocera viscosa TUFC12733]